MNETELRRLSQLRATLEGLAARHAAMHAAVDKEHSRSLGPIIKLLNKAVRARDYAAFRKADEKLHETIIALAHVPLMDQVWRTVWNGLQSFHQRGFEVCFPDSRILIEEHQHLVETIELGDPVAAEDAARNHVEAVWFRLAELQAGPADGDDDPLARAVAHLAFRLHCTIRLEEVASTVAYTSPGNLSRLFRQRYGMNFREYLQKLRLEKAAELLSSTRLSITSVARRVGYRDVSRFGQHFKRLYRTGPRRWRSANRAS